MSAVRSSVPGSVVVAEPARTPRPSSCSADSCEGAGPPLGPPGERTSWWELTTGALLAVFFVFTTWLPVMDGVVPAVVTTGVRGGLVVVGLATLGRSPRRGALPAVLVVVFFALWWASTPLWSEWAPRSRVVRLEQQSVVGNALTSLACLLLAGGRRSGVVGVRWAWLVMVASTVPLGVCEVVTHRHLVPPEAWRPPPV